MQFMGLDYSDYDSYIYYKSREALGVQEVLVVRVYRRDDLTAVEDAIDRRVADQTRTFEGYGPSQVAMLKNAIIYKRGNYISIAWTKILTGMRRCSVMLFSSIVFIFCFLPILLAVYFLVPKKYLFARNIVLLLFSLVFYSWGEPVYVFLMIYSAFFNYFMAHLIAQDRRKGGSGKRDFLFALVMNLFILCFFKYFGFLMDTVNGIFHSHISYTALSLPIGISFYTFQALSYIIDVYRDKVKPQSSFLNFALYLALFPQLIAGPIVKYIDIESQLSYRETNPEKFGQGATRFMLGLGKKVLLANNLGALHQLVLNLPDSQASVLSFWIGALAYTLQIYFDFSGYSDMAIGLGRMFGFEFLENFNYPYISRSVTEFWRRWHMSLSGWFRDYLYIPLGGNRVTVPRHILNLLIVWSLTGLWHGASWNFVFWGYITESC
ncbi:MBOAT family O-acyltransferase [Hornefia porci]|uniref:MBOAT family O-acyltransferase n=1 Tax=Hornefia porci TaxID=2652292 RepID=UPI000AE93358